MNYYDVTIVLPIFNAQTTIAQTITSLLQEKKYFKQLLLIDNNSTDNSRLTALKTLRNSKIDYKYLINKINKGLAYSYNRGIKLCKTKIVVTLQADVIITKGSLLKLISPLFQKNNIVATTHTEKTSKDVWQSYNYWQKVFFSRQAETEQKGINGRFDAFKTSALKKIGLFDHKTYRTAGEDGDIVYKLNKIGKVKYTNAKIIHIHSRSPSFSPKDIYYKHAQYSQTYGVWLRKGIINTPKKIIFTHFREILLISLLIPYLKYISFCLIILYCFLYTKTIFKQYPKDLRTYLLPLINISLLFVSFYFTLDGFIRQKQTL